MSITTVNVASLLVDNYNESCITMAGTGVVVAKKVLSVQDPALAVLSHRRKKHEIAEQDGDSLEIRKFSNIDYL